MTAAADERRADSAGHAAASQQRAWRLPVVGRDERQLPCPLDAGQLAERRRTLARQQQQVADLAAKADALAARLAAVQQQLAEATAGRDVTAGQVADASRMQPVRCLLYGDTAAGVVYVVRADTQQLVDCRPMTDDDRQVRLHLLPE